MASFGPPKLEEQLLFGALVGRRAEIDRFLGMLTGAVPISKYFALNNLIRIIGVRGMAKVMLSKILTSKPGELERATSDHARCLATAPSLFADCRKEAGGNGSRSQPPYTYEPFCSPGSLSSRRGAVGGLRAPCGAPRFLPVGADTLSVSCGGGERGSLLSSLYSDYDTMGGTVAAGEVLTACSFICCFDAVTTLTEKTQDPHHPHNCPRRQCDLLHRHCASGLGHQWFPQRSPRGLD